MEPRTHWVSGEVRLRVLEWPGEKGTILALHGLTGYAETFLPLIPALNPPYRVLSMDLRGRGESEQPADERAYGVDAHLRDIRAVLEALAPEGALLMGHSLGAMLALAVAAEHPDRVRGMLLFDGGPLPSRAFSESLNQVLNARLEELPSREAFRELVRSMPFLQPFDERLMPILEAGLIQEPDGRVRVRFPSRLGKLEAMELGAIWNERLRAYRGRIRCPALLLKAPVGTFGPHDRFFAEDEEHLLREVIPQVRIVEVPNTTHYTIVLGYHPERDRLVRAFVEEVLGVSWAQRIRDFGGEGPLIHLAVANGFPGCYRPLMQALASAGHGVSLLPRPLWPDGERPRRGINWYTLAEDLIEAFDALGWREAIGIGHSMGGVITMVAAVRRPDLFRALVLMDPVLMDPKVLQLFRILRALGLGARLHPLARRARRRRRVWPDQEAAAAHLRSRPLFAAWHPDAFAGYLEEGLRPSRDGQVALAYPPEWEVHIFVNVPHDAWRFVPHIPVPTLVLRGAATDTFTADSEGRFRRLKPDAQFEVIPGGHLFPMERPEETAQVILRWIRGLGCG